MNILFNDLSRLCLPLSLPISGLAIALLASSGCSPEEVDETGYLVGPAFDVTTNQRPSDDELVDYFIIGQEGAVEQGGGTLTISASSGAQASVNIQDPPQPFLQSLPAGPGDTLFLAYDLDGDELEIFLSDAAVREEPGCGACVIDGFVSPASPEGEVTVDISSFVAANPPYTIFNTNGAAILRVDALGEYTFAANTGDTVCIFESGGQTSEALCEEVR